MRKPTPYRHKAPAPYEGNAMAAVVAGTVAWFAVGLGLLPFYGRLEDGGHEWWIWTCLCGGGLGLIGVWYTRAWERTTSKPRAVRTSDSAGPERGGDEADEGTS